MRVSCKDKSCIAQGFCSRLKQRYNATQLQQTNDKMYNAKFLCLLPPQSISRNMCTVINATEHSSGDSPTTSLIPEVCFMSIAMFLPVRDLFNFIFLNNGILQLLTTEVVIKSAMLAGGNAHKKHQKTHATYSGSSDSCTKPAAPSEIVMCYVV